MSSSSVVVGVLPERAKHVWRLLAPRGGVHLEVGQSQPLPLVVVEDKAWPPAPPDHSELSARTDCHFPRGLLSPLIPGVREAPAVAMMLVESDCGFGVLARQPAVGWTPAPRTAGARRLAAVASASASARRAGRAPVMVATRTRSAMRATPAAAAAFAAVAPRRFESALSERVRDLLGEHLLYCP